MGMGIDDRTLSYAAPKRLDVRRMMRIIGGALLILLLVWGLFFLVSQKRDPALRVGLPREVFERR